MSENLGYIKKFNRIYILQIKMQVGILIGIFQNLVNLQNIVKVNIMVGIMIVGINLMKIVDQNRNGRIRKLSVNSFFI
jgi:hypothetical protein